MTSCRVDTKEAGGLLLPDTKLMSCTGIKLTSTETWNRFWRA